MNLYSKIKSNLKESDTSDITNKIKNNVGEIIRKHWSTIYSDEWFDKNDLRISLPDNYGKQEVVIDFKNRKEPYYLVNSNELKELKEDLKSLGLKGLHIKTKTIKPSWEDRKYTEVLSISYPYEDESRKEIHEAENTDNKVYYFMVGICLDKNRPNAIKEDFADWPWTKIPYKLLDENWGVDKTKEEAINWVKNYIADGVPGTFGIVTEAIEPYEGFKEEIHNGNHNDMDWSDIQKGKLIYSAYKEDKNPESIKVIIDETKTLDESEKEDNKEKTFTIEEEFNSLEKLQGAIDNPNRLTIHYAKWNKYADGIGGTNIYTYCYVADYDWTREDIKEFMSEENIKKKDYKGDSRRNNIGAGGEYYKISKLKDVLIPYNHGSDHYYLVSKKDSQLNESETEDKWDATELDRVGFMALLKFNHPEKHANPSMQYIITNDNNEVYRFAMQGENEKNKDIGAKIEFRKYINKEESDNLSLGESALNTKYYVVSYPESNDFCETYKTFTTYNEAYNYLITNVDAEKIFERYDSETGEYIEKLDKTRDLEDKGKIPVSSEREAYLQKAELNESDDDDFWEETPYKGYIILRDEKNGPYRIFEGGRYTSNHSNEGALFQVDDADIYRKIENNPYARIVIDAIYDYYNKNSSLKRYLTVHTNKAFAEFVIDAMNGDITSENYKSYLNKIEENELDESQKLKEEFIPNYAGLHCPKCGSNEYYEIDDEEYDDGTQKFHYECNKCGYISNQDEFNHNDFDEAQKLKEAVELSYDDYYDFGNEDNEDELFCAQCGNPVKPDFCYVVDESDPHSEVYCWRCYEDLSSQGMLESDNFNTKKELNKLAQDILSFFNEYNPYDEYGDNYMKDINEVKATLNDADKDNELIYNLIEIVKDLDDSELKNKGEDLIKRLRMNESESKKLKESISYASEKEIKDMTDEELEDYLNYLKDEMIYHTTKKKAEIEKEIEKITKILYDRDYYIDYSNPDVNTIKFDKDGNEITTKEDK